MESVELLGAEKPELAPANELGEPEPTGGELVIGEFGEVPEKLGTGLEETAVPEDAPVPGAPVPDAPVPDDGAKDDERAGLEYVLFGNGIGWFCGRWFCWAEYSG